MKILALLSTFFVLLAAPIGAQTAALPTIAAGGIQNSASYAARGLPNSAIAQGSIFSVFGTNLGPDTAELGFNFPLPTVTPNGKVSVSATVNGTSTQAIILYSGKTQINAVLPSSTPVGTGTLTVTVNGQSGAPAPLEVVASDFGIFTINSAGTGPGIVTYADYSLVTADKSANPGDTLIIWGTGLGPVAGDEAASALPGDQTSVPVEVYAGGAQAAVVYRGRSGCCSGLDQIVFVVPAGVEGCAVPLAVKIGDRVSNFTSMPVAASGRSCTDATTGLASTAFSTLFNKPASSVGFVRLSRTTTTNTGPGTQPVTINTIDSGTAGFARVSIAPGTTFIPGLFSSVALGSCSVNTIAGTAAQNPFTGLNATGLDAGAGIAIGSPSGARTLTPTPSAGTGFYANSNLGDGTAGNFLDPGTYSVAGSGGVDIGLFTTSARVPAALVWTNQSAIQNVNENAGVTVTWSGGDPNGYVSIDGTSGNPGGVGAGFHCEARVSDGTFTIPPAVLLSLPASASASSAGTLSVGSATTSTSFTASGLDLGLVTAVTASSKNVNYLNAALLNTPVANAGTNQVVTVGAVVQLNGSASVDPGGNPLTYQWSLTTIPAGSAAVLANANSAIATFTADRPGTYVAQLIVNNGKASSSPATVTISTSTPAAPTANAGPNQNAALNAVVALNGSGTDPQGLPLTYKWSLTTKPAGSVASLSNAGIASPVFTADKAGAYVAQLIVNNGFLDSAPSTVTITVSSPGQPVANPGANRSNVAIGSTVVLDGSASSSPSGAPLTYSFTFVSRPTASAAVLTGANTAKPSFVADVAGTYVIQLVVNDGTQSSAPVTVTITAGGGPAASITVLGGTPQSAQISTAFPLPLTVTVKDASGNPVSGAVVTFGAPGVGASGTFAGGVVTATTSSTGVAASPAFTANGIAGSYVVTASVAGVSAPANFLLTNTAGVPPVTAATIAATAGTPQTANVSVAFAAPLTVTVKDSSGNPVSGVTVTFTAPASGASGTFAGGVNTAVTNASGIAASPAFTANATAGSYTVTASTPGVATAAAFALTNSAITGSGLAAANTAVGQNLQTSANVTVPTAAPTAGVPVTLTSNDPSRLLLATTPAAAGAASITVTIPANATRSPDFYVQGLASSGTATYAASAPGFGTSTGTVTLTPSGIIIAGPFGPGGPNFTTSTISAPSPINVYPVQVDPASGTFLLQAIRGGSSAAVTLTNSNPGAGTLAASQLTIPGGSSTAATVFQPAGAGSTILSVNVPSGFTALAQDTSVTAIVDAAGVSISDQLTIGMNLEVGGTLVVGQPAPAGGQAVTLTSNSPKLLLSTSPTAAGTSLITVTVPSGSNNVSYYLQALASSGTATYTATAPGLQPRTATVTFGPSGVVLVGPFGLGVPFPITTKTTSAPTALSVSPALLDVSGNYLATQQLAGGLTVAATLSSSAPTVGTITPSATITGGSSSASVQFTPKAVGSTTLSVATPAGYAAPSAPYRTVTANVQ